MLICDNQQRLTLQCPGNLYIRIRLDDPDDGFMDIGAMDAKGGIHVEDPPSHVCLELVDPATQPSPLRRAYFRFHFVIAPVSPFWSDRSAYMLTGVSVTGVRQHSTQASTPSVDGESSGLCACARTHDTARSTSDGRVSAGVGLSPQHAPLGPASLHGQRVVGAHRSARTATASPCRPAGRQRPATAESVTYSAQVDLHPGRARQPRPAGG